MKELTELLAHLPKKAAPGRLWLVGGFLRDALLGRPLKDVDAAVQGDAEAASKKWSRFIGGKSFPLDVERGTYRVVHTVAGTPVTFDFSKLQGKTLEDDLGKRDFTINALALPAESYGASSAWEKDVIDLSQGLKDLKSKIIRLVSPKALVADPLRLIRAFRFQAELDFKIDPATLKQIAAKRKLISRPAGERIREELLRMLETPRAEKAFRAMDKAGLLSVLFPEGEKMRRTAHGYYGKGGVLDHSLEAMAAFEELMERLPKYFPKFAAPLNEYLNAPLSGHPRYAVLKLAELLHDVGKPDTAEMKKGKMIFYGHEHVGGKIAEKISRRWRLSGNETKSLTALVRGHMRPGNLGNLQVLTDRAIYRFYRDLGDDAVGMLMVSLADHFTYLSQKEKSGGKDPVFKAIKRMLGTFFLERSRVQPPKIINGKILMKALKLKEGPIIGQLLESIREAQVAGKVKTLEDALRLARGK